MKFFLLVFLTVSTLSTTAKTNSVAGVVYDFESGLPLAFVNIIANDNPYLGTISDIDGKFSISASGGINSLSFSYVGYQSKEILIDDDGEPLHVVLRKKSTVLEEIVILPGINPAHRIIKLAVKNRNINNPEKLDGFRYVSYNKFYVTGRDLKDSLTGSGASIIITEKPDSARSEQDSVEFEIRNFLEKQHLFLMESISERKYKRPDRDKETILATRVSGLKDPSFFILATQMQSFSFYDTYINILDRSYLNPISKGSVNKYLFVLEDTTYHGIDTVYIISFRPKQNKNFDGLEGVIYINTNTFAVQNVLANVYDSTSIDIQIQQNYEFIDGKQWFPTQLNTDIIFRSLSVNKLAVTGVGRSYLDEISIDTLFKNKSFKSLGIELDRKATKMPDEFWARYRNDTLDAKEQETYRFIDSIGEEHNLDRTVKVIDALVNGRIRAGIFDIDYRQWLDFNNHEGFRLGFGMRTNERMSDVFSIGGYAAYGFKDKKFKYGGDVLLSIDPRNDFSLFVQYSKDVIESGTYHFYKERKLLFDEQIRKFLRNNMYLSHEWGGGIRLKMFKYLSAELYAYRANQTATNQYAFQGEEKSVGVGETYSLAHIGIRLRYAFREKTALINNRIVLLGSVYPIIWVNYARGMIGPMGGQFDYHKLEAKLEKQFVIKDIGKTRFTIDASKVFGEVPYFQQYFAIASDGRNSFYYVNNSFNTMQVSSFLSDQQVTIFFSHSFGHLLWKRPKFKPEFRIISGFSIGSLEKPQNHTGITYQTLEKGYFESGLIINDLLTLPYFNTARIGFGVGFFTSYGAYASPQFWKNSSVKLSFSVGSN